MAINNKYHSNNMLCSIMTCGRKSKHKLRFKAYNNNRNTFLCSQCYIAYQKGRTHFYNKTVWEEEFSFKV